MKKNFIRTVAAAACAAVMAAQAMAVSVAAVDYYYYYNGVYYASPYEAAEAAGNKNGAYVSVPSTSIPANAVKKYYDPVSNKTYDSIASITSAGVTNYDVIYVGTFNGYTPYDINYYGYGYSYYSSYTNRYYATYDAAVKDSNNEAKYVTYVGNTYYNGYYSNYYGYAYNHGYYSSYTGKYYSTYQDALNASNGNSKYVTYVGYDPYYYNGYYYNNSKLPYYNTYTKSYYSTLADAAAATKGDTKYVVYVGGGDYRLYDGHVSNVGSIYKYYYNGVAYPSLDEAKKAGGTVGVDIYYSVYGSAGDKGYYYYYNGTYYGTLDAAKKAGGTALGDDITYVPYNYYGNAGPMNGFYDPYGKVASGSLFTEKKTTTDTHTAADGEPYIYGNKKRAGWTNIVNYIKKASKGSTIKIDMNGSYVIDSSVLTALKGKNVNLTAVLDNGVKWTINGNNVNSTADMNIATEYNIDFIPVALVKKAAKDSVAHAQVGISYNYDRLSADSSVTVKFPSKRSGCTATIYRYDPEANSLKKADKAKVLSDGTCTFEVKNGSPYLIVLN